MKRVLCVVGTRPEAIKMSPVIHELKRRPDDFDTEVMATGQHREMLDQVMTIFDIIPDYDLNVMKPRQTLTGVTCAVLSALDVHVQEHPVDVLLAQGDTTTVMATAIACFYHQIDFGHVEAGLRTHNLYSPYPEEFNRRIAGLISAYHFAPTPTSAGNLKKERISEDHVYVTGNSVIDALFYVKGHTNPSPSPIPEGQPYMLMTCHRRENFGDPVHRIFKTVKGFAQDHPDLFIWYPVHPNPQVKEPAHEILGDIANIRLTAPLNYVDFSHAMAGCEFVLSDSGGVQEEAPSLGKPVLVLRENTERPEGVEAGTCKLVGSDADTIRAHLEQLYAKDALYKTMSQASNPYGDGKTSERIANVLAGRPFNPVAR